MSLFPNAPVRFWTFLNAICVAPSPTVPSLAFVIFQSLSDGGPMSVLVPPPPSKLIFVEWTLASEALSRRRTSAKVDPVMRMPPVEASASEAVDTTARPLSSSRY